MNSTHATAKYALKNMGLLNDTVISTFIILYCENDPLCFIMKKRGKNKHLRRTAGVALKFNFFGDY